MRQRSTALVCFASFLCVAFIAPALPAQDVEWQLADIGTRGDVGPISDIAIGPNNYPRVVYRGNERMVNGRPTHALMYAQWTGFKWLFEKVEDLEGQQIRWVSIDIDDNGVSHIAYYVELREFLFNLNRVKYAVKAGGQWLVENVAGPFPVLDEDPQDEEIDVARRRNICIAVESGAEAIPHISYADFPASRYMHTRRDSGTSRWVGQAEMDHDAVDQSSLLPDYSSLALDSNNQPYLSCFSASPASKGVGSLVSLTIFAKFYRWRQVTGTWGGMVSEQTPDVLFANEDFYTTLRYPLSRAIRVQIDPDDIPHVVMSTPGGHGLYARWDSASLRWVTEDVPMELETGISGRALKTGFSGGFALGRDQDFNLIPSICYAKHSRSELEFLMRDPITGWMSPAQEVDEFGKAPALAIDDEGTPHICYQTVLSSPNYTTLPTRLAYATTNRFQIQTIAIDPTQITDISMTLDGEGMPHLSFTGTSETNAMARDLKYATWDGDVDSWLVETAAVPPPAIDFGGPGFGASIRVFNRDTEPVVGISHYQIEYGGGGVFASKLLFTYRTPTGWETETIEENLFSTDYCALMNEANLPVVAYWNEEDGTRLLKLARRNTVLPGGPSGWNVFTQDPPPSGRVGSQVSAVLLDTGDFVFCYYDDVERALRGARMNSQFPWVDERIDGASMEVNAGKFAAITRLGLDSVVVAYTLSESLRTELYGAPGFILENGGLNWIPRNTGIASIIDSLDVSSMMNRIHVAYTSRQSNRMFLAAESKTGSSLEPERIDENAKSHDRVDLEIYDREIIAYKASPPDVFQQELRMAARIAPDFPPPPEVDRESLQPGAGGGLRALLYWLQICAAERVPSRKNVQATTTDDPDLLPVRTIFERMNSIQQGSDGGRRMLSLFNAHAEELEEIERSDIDLRWKAYRTVSSFLPGFAYVGVGRGAEQIFTQAMANQTRDLWEAVIQKASPTMATEIQTELDRWGNFQDFVGANFDETFDAIAKGDVTKVNVNPTVEIARWSLVHGTGEVISGTGSAALFSVTPGEVTLTWEDLEGHSFRSPNPQTQTILEFAVIEFEGVFVPFGDTNGDGITNYVDVFFFSLFWRGDPNAVSFSTNPIFSEPDAIDDRDLLELIWRWR